MSLEIYCRTRLTKINCKEKWYSVGKMTFLIKLVFYQKHLNVWNLNFILKVPLVGPTQIRITRRPFVNEDLTVANM